MSKSSSGNDSESTTLGWKFVFIVAVITTIFFTFLYLAMSSEPDYMPSQQLKKSQQQNTSTQPVSDTQPPAAEVHSSQHSDQHSPDQHH